MKASEYLLRTADQRQELAVNHPIWFLAGDCARNACVVALVLVVSDITASPFLTGNPILRVQFLAIWSFLMAGWNLWRMRHRFQGKQKLQRAPSN